jgi:hypothetical protein
MAKKRVFVARSVVPAGGRFADIMKQSSKPDFEWVPLVGSVLECVEEVLVDVIYVSTLLVATDTFIELRDDMTEEAGLFEEADTVARARALDDFYKLIPYTFRGDMSEEFCTGSKRDKCFMCNSKAECCGKPHCSEHTKRIFLEAYLRIKDTSYLFVFYVFLSVIRVYQGV